MALNYDQLTATTKELHIPKLVDNFFSSNVLLSRLRKRGTRKDGGTKITQPLIYAENDNGGAYSPTDQQTISATEEISAAEFDWKYYWTAIKIDQPQILKNMGVSQVVNLLEAKVRIAEKSLIKDMTTGLYSDGTGSSAKVITGLAAAIDDGTNIATYGGIKRTATVELDGYLGSFWKSQYDANGGTGRALTLALMQKMYGLCSDVQDKPTLIIVPQLVFDKYWALLTPNQRFSSSETASAGFTNLLFNGIPVVVDKNCTAQTMYYINEEYIDFVCHRQRNFEVTPFKELETYDMVQSKIYWMGNLTSSNCRFQGKIVDVDPSL